MKENQLNCHFKCTLNITLPLSMQGMKVKRNVIMLHCIAWPDMTAPDDTRILLELVYAAEEQLVFVSLY